MKCIVCDNPLTYSIYNNTLLKCKNCGFITANSSYTSAELEAIYSENYFKGGEYLDYLADSDAAFKNANSRIKDIQSEFINYNPKKALEIGCAYGLFGKSLSNLYKDVEYIGYDVVLEACEYGCKDLGLNIKCEDFLNSTHSEIYSDIFMWDVIEHLPNPDKFIQKIATQSIPGTRLFISTGDIEKLLPKIQGKNWRQIHPPSHLHYFSKKTLSLLLKNNGFKVKKVLYPGIYRSVKQTWFSLFLLNKKPSRFANFIYNLIPSKLFFKINTYDLMFIIAEKYK